MYEFVYPGHRVEDVYDFGFVIAIEVRGSVDGGPRISCLISSSAQMSSNCQENDSVFGSPLSEPQGSLKMEISTFPCCLYYFFYGKVEEVLDAAFNI